MKKQTAVTCALVAAIIAAPVALAQQPKAGAAPKAGAPKAGATPPMTIPNNANGESNIRQGPAIPGVCVMNEMAVIAASKVGQYVIQRIETLKAGISAELNVTNNALQAERSNLQAAINATSQQANAAAIEAYQAKATQFQNSVQEREDQIDRTRDKAFADIFEKATPLLGSTYSSHNCSILLNSEGVMTLNPAMDITRDIITALDLVVTEIPVELVPLASRQGATGAAPGAVPLAPQPAAPARGPAGPPR